MRFFYSFQVIFQFFFGEAKIFYFNISCIIVQKAKHHFFSVKCGKDRNTDIKFNPVIIKKNSAILRESLFINAECGSYLYFINENRIITCINCVTLDQISVNAETDATFFFVSFDMHIAGTKLFCLCNNSLKEILAVTGI